MDDDEMRGLSEVVLLHPSRTLTSKVKPATLVFEQARCVAKA